jgi:hypothetical protein
MTSPIADGVLAATHRLVQQAMSGQWQEVPKTIEERRVLLDKLSASASPSDQQWLGALKQAMAESDAAVAKMSAVDGIVAPNATPAKSADDAHSADSFIDSTLDMIRGSR